MTSNELARHIDHTALKPGTTDAEIRTLCEEAHRFGFAAVCVMPYYIPLACAVLEGLGSDVALCAPVGFPNGLHQTVLKVAETKKAIHDGAREIDMVLNVGALKSGHERVVMADILAVVMAAREGDAIVKVILETALLSDEEKRLACELATRAGADFVKTSTGFGGGGATLDDIRLMRLCSGPNVRVKASGGIRDHATAMAMIAAGAARIGTSSGMAIMAEHAGIP
ncbi:MAG: deoxyribose-phosphate aldolase [Bacteroidota bacterium]